MNEITCGDDDTKLTFTRVPWDCTAFERNCYELSLSLGTNRPEPPAVCAVMRQARMDAVTCRRVAEDPDVAGYLRSIGFFRAELQLDYLPGEKFLLCLHLLLF